MTFRKITFSPPQVLSLTFLILILIGSVLLKLPISTKKTISWIDAFFTATSAVTITGLNVVDTGQVFTIFGQCIILLLIQVGGLGITTFAIFVVILLGKKIGLKERLLIGQTLNQSGIGGMIFLVKRLFMITIFAECIGALFLFLRWIPLFGWKKSLYTSFFYSISAFNNAGFSIWDDSLSRFVGDPIVNIVITLLFITGGVGFTVLIDIWSKKKLSQLSLHSKIMLMGTLIINIIAILFVFISECDNTLKNLSLSEKIWASYFQGLSPRTAGFNTIDIGSFDESTITFMILLMFIGGGSTSTAGGIKLTTFIIMILSIVTFLQGKSEMVIFRRTISQKTIIRSLSVAMIGFTIVFIGAFLLHITENVPFLSVLFETVSAFGTVGLSMGLTPGLSTLGKLICVCLMLIGKIGPLTLVFSFASPKEQLIHYPEEEVFTG